MKSLEWRKYIPTPNDLYMLGIAEIRLTFDCGGKIILRYKHVKAKDGSGTFFTPATYSQEENGVKKYIPCFMFDSVSDKEDVEKFVRESVNAEIHGKTTTPPVQAQAQAVHYPHGMCQPGGVAQEQPLPF